MRISLRLGIAAMLCLVASGWSVPTTAKDKVQQKDIPIVKNGRQVIAKTDDEQVHGPARCCYWTSQRKAQVN